VSRVEHDRVATGGNPGPEAGSDSGSEAGSDPGPEARSDPGPEARSDPADQLGDPEDESPAQRYVRFRRGKLDRLTTFAGTLPFQLDAFQRDACAALQAGSSVLVAAPTGSGKTVVGEFAVHLALAEGSKCFYTTPIKALSNQKYADLVDRYGSGAVGLLTGDNSVNGDAPVVVMTTEVLRNMLYAGSATLDRLGYVVMDEVHYLADRARGVVWEEVIIHLPDAVRMVALSATVSNVEEFGAWLREVRGNTDLVVSEHRPVPLHQHVLVDDHLVDLFAPDRRPPDGVAVAVAGAPVAGAGVAVSGGPAAPLALRAAVNPRLVRLAGDETRQSRIAGSGRGRAGGRGKPGRGGLGAPGGGGGRGGGPPRRSHHTPDRVQAVERLLAGALLPAIVFVFSRAGCDAAVEQLRSANVRLTTPAEREQIRDYAEERCSVIPDEDLHVLGYHDWLSALENGVAAHHAGVLPTLKEIVEELFTRGLVKVVYATETLALGINMPARSVVLERLVKWNGETHADITPGEYTQLTGRAGRRGIDVEGHAVVVWQGGLDPGAVAGLASTRTYPLRSSFRPSYGMAVNLVRRSGRPQARVLLESSFAQFQADRDVVGLVRRVRRNEEALTGYAVSATCHLGDLLEYAGLRRRLDRLEAEHTQRRGQARRSAVADSLADLDTGDVVVLPAGRRAGPVVVLDPGFDGYLGGGADRRSSDRRQGRADPVLRPIGGDPMPTVLGTDGRVRRVTVADFPAAVDPAARLAVPRTFDARDPVARRELAAALTDLASRIDGPAPTPPGEQPGAVDEVAAARRAVVTHPCHGCADRDAHLRWAARYERLETETAALRSRVSSRTGTIARIFDRVCGVLDELGYLAGDELTADGEVLRAVYTELDLLTAQCLRRGVWAGLDPAELAACLSALTYAARRDDELPPRVPGEAVRAALRATTAAWSELVALERAAGLDTQREPDPGFTQVTWRWASGATLDDVLSESGVSPGDFIRQVKQVLDLADQVAVAATRAGDTALAATARSAMVALRRGVVAYATAV